MGLGLSAIRVKNKKESKKPVSLHIGMSITEAMPELKDAGLYLGQPFPSWSDVPDKFFKKATSISDFTLFDHPRLVAEIVEHYSKYEMLQAIRAIAREFSPTEKIPEGITHWVWFPMETKLYGSSFAYCHAVDPKA